MKDSCGTRCNIIGQTSIDYDDSLIEYMNQKLNYFKALQIAASLSDCKVFLNKEKENSI